MKIELIMTLITSILGLFSLIISISNFITTKREIVKKINTTNHNILIDSNMNILNMSLNNICREIYNYFTNIAPNNNYTVKILKIIKNGKEVAPVASYPQIIFYSCLIKDNTELYETISTKKPYYINNIPYFSKHGNNYFTSNGNWEKHYKSIICYPIKQQSRKKYIYNIIGFLVVEIAEPLNDLININIILDYMKQKCEIINMDNEFNNNNFKIYGYSSNNGWNIDTSNKTLCEGDEGHILCGYQWEETVDVSDHHID